MDHTGVHGDDDKIISITGNTNQQLHRILAVPPGGGQAAQPVPAAQDGRQLN